MRRRRIRDPENKMRRIAGPPPRHASPGVITAAEALEHLSDRQLIEWLANAQLGEKLPDEFVRPGLPRKTAGTFGVVARLVRAGVMEPPLGESLEGAARKARTAAQAWLQLHA